MEAENADREQHARAEAERFEEEMVRYELAKAAHHAAAKLSFGRRFLDEAKQANRAGRATEGGRLLAKATKWLNEVVRLYGDTESAADAKQLLDGKEVPERRVPPAPTLPQGVTARDHDVRENEAVATAGRATSQTQSENGTVAANPGAGVGGKSVYVRGYTRKDGTYVQPHYRSAPGSARSSGRR